jgi:YfiH family protein
MDRGNLMLETDALVTCEPGVLLGVTIADCLPVFFVDPVRRSVALAHAGWRGLVAGVLRSTVEVLQAAGTDPENLRVVIGPGIGPCHYDIGSDVATKFSAHPLAVRESRGRTWLDLKLVAEEQLRELGVIGERIGVSSDCTACLPQQYFSYRRDQPEHLETMLAVIGLVRP